MQWYDRNVCEIISKNLTLRGFLKHSYVVQIDENSNSSLGTFYFVDKIEPLWERKILENDQNYPAWSLDNAIFIWNAKEDPGLLLFSLFEKQTGLEKLFVFVVLFMYNCCGQL